MSSPSEDDAGYSDLLLVAGSLSLFFTVVSCVCTTLTIWLCYRLGVKLGYLRLVFSLSVMQLTYDVGLLLVPLYRIDVARYFNVFLCALGGVATSLWSNVVSLVVVHIVVRLKSFNINTQYPTMAAIITGAALGFAVALVSMQPEHRGDPLSTHYEMLLQVYLWLRLASIMLNVLAWVAVAYRLSSMGFTARSLHPVMVLANRLKWYPIIQAVSRAFASWYEIGWGWNTASYDGEKGPLHDAALLTFAVFTPMAGIGYFCLFLFMQKDANALFCASAEQWGHSLRASCVTAAAWCGCGHSGDEDDLLTNGRDSMDMDYVGLTGGPPSLDRSSAGRSADPGGQLIGGGAKAKASFFGQPAHAVVFEKGVDGPSGISGGLPSDIDASGGTGLTSTLNALASAASGDDLSALSRSSHLPDGGSDSAAPSGSMYSLGNSTQISGDSRGLFFGGGSSSMSSRGTAASAAAANTAANTARSSRATDNELYQAWNALDDDRLIEAIDAYPNPNPAAETSSFAWE